MFFVILIFLSTLGSYLKWLSKLLSEERLQQEKRKNCTFEYVASSLTSLAQHIVRHVAPFSRAASYSRSANNVWPSLQCMPYLRANESSLFIYVHNTVAALFNFMTGRLEVACVAAGIRD